MSDALGEAPTLDHVEASENVPTQDISEPQAHPSIMPGAEGSGGGPVAALAELARRLDSVHSFASAYGIRAQRDAPLWLNLEWCPACGDAGVLLMQAINDDGVRQLRVNAHHDLDQKGGCALEEIERALSTGDLADRPADALDRAVEWHQERVYRSRDDEPKTPHLKLVEPSGDDPVVRSATQSRLTTAAQRRDRPEPEWSVEKVIPEWGVGQIFGRSYSGKTYVALDLALRFVNDVEDWHGHQLKRPGPVVYVLMEGAFDFQARIDAWLSAHPGCTDDALYTLEEEPVDLADPDSLDALMLDVELEGIDPALVVVDTQALATPGADENSNSEMNLVFAKLKLLSKRLGCPVMTVHHTGHEQTQRSRGASSVFAALDFQLRVADGEISVPKVKAGRPIEGLAFRITSGANGSAYAQPVEQADAAGVRLAAASAEVEGREQRIVGYIAARGEATAAQVAELLGLGESTVRGTLRGLAEDGRLERVEGGHTQGGRQPHRFRIPEPTDG